MPGWKNTLALVADLPDRLQAMMQLMARQDEPRSWAVRNGDLGIAQQPEKLHVSHCLVIAAFHVLVWSTTGSGKKERRFLPLEDSTDRASLYGYHADDWFRAMYAVRAFHDRRKKHTIDVPAGQYGKGYQGLLCVASVTDSTAMIKEDIEEISEEAKVVEYNMLLCNSFRATVPASVTKTTDNATFLGVIARRTDHFVLYTSSLRMENVTGRSKETISANMSRARQLDERYLAIVPLTFSQMARIIEMTRQMFKAPKYYVVSEDALDKWASLLGSGFAETLHSAQDLSPALQEIDKKYNGFQRDLAVRSVRKLLDLSAVTSSLTDTVPPRPMDFPRAVHLVGGNFDAIAKSGKGWSSIPVPGTDPKFGLRPHQLVSAYQLRELCDSPLRGGILANSVGMGKTFSAVALVLMEHQKCLDAKAEGQPFKARPSMILAPANLMRQIHEEISTTFPGRLKLWVYHGNADTNDPSMAKDLIESPEAFAALLTDWHFDSDNTDVSSIFSCRFSLDPPVRAGAVIFLPPP